MPFSIGANRSHSSSTSESDAYGYSGGASSSVNTSRSGSVSRSGGTSFGESGSRSTQSLAFADLLSALYGDALGATGRVAQNVPALETVAGSLFDSGVGFLDQLGGGAGADYLDARLSGQDGILDDQLAGLSEDVGRFFSEELLPGVTDSAIRAGQLGGGRQGVAQGRAIDTAAREFRRGATDLRVADRAARDQAAVQAATLGQAGGVAGVAALPGLYGLREAGAGAALSPYERLAALVGGPTVLTEATSFGSQGSENFATADAFSLAEAIANSFNFGEDFATSSSQTTSKSKGFTFGL